MLTLIITMSFLLSKYNQFKNKLVRDGFVIGGAFFGIISFFLVFLDQPRFTNVLFNYLFGIPIMTFGIIGRLYAALYLRSKGTTTTLDAVSTVIKSGPYKIVRHPQYTTGILSLIGWFMIWGAGYCLLIFPLLTLIIILQASIEEKYILEKEFGVEYTEYQKQVGMIVPKLKRS